jgi:tetratricopeptide (TPR) repeat protein
MMRNILVLAVIALVIASCKTDPKGGSSGSTEDSTTVQLNPFDSISQLIEADPENADLIHARAEMFLEAGELSVALGDAGRAIMLDSSKAKYFLTISDIYFKGNKPAQSMASLKKAGELEPLNIEVPLRLAEFYLYIQNYTEAVKATNDALKMDGKSDRAFFLKGISYKEVGDTVKAAEQFLRAVENNPDHVDAYVELGILYDIKDDPIAEQYYRNALKVNPDSKEALYGLGILLQDYDRLNEALKVYTELVQKHPDHASAMYNMGFINFEFIKDYNQALRYFEDAVAANPEYVAAIYMRGLCYESMGNVDRAKAEYQFALEKDPTFSLALTGLERLL